MIASMSRLADLDWLVIAVYAAGMLAVGWFYRGRTRTADDYLLGGRRMRPWTVGLSLFATLVSALSYLANPGEVLRHGPGVLTEIAAFPFVVFLVGWLVIPAIMRQRVSTAYELLETRLGLGARLAGALCFLAMRFIWMAVIISVTTSKVLVPVLGLSEGTVPYVCVAMGLVTVVYTSMGGLRAVVAADVAQTCIMLVGALLTLAVIAHATGLAAWWPQTWPEHWTRLRLLPEAGVDRWPGGFFLMGLTWYTCTAASDQMAIQRYLATRDAQSARRAFTISMLADAVMLLFLGAVGLALLAYVRHFPGVLPTGVSPTENADQIFPFFIVHGLPAGVSGLVIAALLAAAMSSLSSGLNSSCAVITVDFLNRLRAPRASTSGAAGRSAGQAKAVSYFVGVAVVLLTAVVGNVEGNVFELCQKLVNLLTAPLAGLFFLALFIPIASPRGALVGTIGGLYTVVLVNYWETITGRPGISFLWAMPLGLAVQLSLGTLASFAWPRKTDAP